MKIKRGLALAAVALAPLGAVAAASVPAGATTAPHAFPDKRLELLFVCAHPAIDAAIRTKSPFQREHRVRQADGGAIRPTRRLDG